MIGGVNNKAIRMLTIVDKFTEIKPILVAYKIKTNLEYDLFSNISKAIELIPWKHEEAIGSIEKFENLFEYVKDKTSSKKWARECMNKDSFKKLVIEKIKDALININSDSFQTEVDKIQKVIVNC